MASIPPHDWPYEDEVLAAQPEGLANLLDLVDESVELPQRRLTRAGR